MLINDVPSLVIYDYTGVNKYPIPFAFYGVESIRAEYEKTSEGSAVLHPLTPDVHFLVTGVVGDVSDSDQAFKSGELTLTAEGMALLANNDKIVIDRYTSIEQEFKYNEYDNFPAKSHENALGRLTLIAQEANDKINRAVLSSPTSGDPQKLVDDLFTARDEAVDAASVSQAAADTAQAAAESANASAETAASTVEQGATDIEQIKNAAVDAVNTAGGEQINLATEQADRAKTEADRAASSTGIPDNVTTQKNVDDELSVITTSLADLLSEPTPEELARPAQVGDVKALNEDKANADLSNVTDWSHVPEPEIGASHIVDYYPKTDEEKASANGSWWRKWSNGFIEQGGAASKGTTADGYSTYSRIVSFLTPFKTSNYTVQAIAQNATAGIGANVVNASTVIMTKSTTNFKFGTWSAMTATKIGWYAAGY